MQRYFLKDEAAMLELGAKLAAKCHAGIVIYLQGPLGAGKTTLVRGLLRALRYDGTIKSPTYTLVESYEINHIHFFHFDLYRLRNPQELLDIGLEDYLQPGSVCLFEWPEKAATILPKANISCTIDIPVDGVGRNITIRGAWST
jgi:tRNA threonylcarbamoyladenosine biosynthesis protein TsaE